MGRVLPKELPEIRLKLGIQFHVRRVIEKKIQLDLRNARPFEQCRV